VEQLDAHKAKAEFLSRIGEKVCVCGREAAEATPARPPQPAHMRTPSTVGWMVGQELHAHTHTRTCAHAYTHTRTAVALFACPKRRNRLRHDRVGCCGSVQEVALAAYAAIPAKIMSTGQKTDVALAGARLGFFHNDLALAAKKLDEAATCVVDHTTHHHPRPHDHHPCTRPPPPRTHSHS
jgi:hypothetical protein